MLYENNLLCSRKSVWHFQFTCRNPPSWKLKNVLSPEGTVKASRTEDGPIVLIRISLLMTKIFVLFCGCGCGWRTFFVFKSLYNNMIYTSYIDVYVCKRNRCTPKVLWVLKFWEVSKVFFFQNHSRKDGFSKIDSQLDDYQAQIWVKFWGF